MNKYLVELIGTFFLVATIGFSVLAPGNAGAMAPLAIGAALMVMVYAGGHVSGAHYNPAVTLAVFIRGKCPAKDVVPYWISQLLGASAAAFVVLFVKGHPVIEIGQLNVAKTLTVEFLFTFALAYVVLNVATSKATAGNSFYGLAIGSTVTAGALAVGPVSGAAFNPAVAVGVTLMGLVEPACLWVFLVATLAGAAAAAVVFKIINPQDS